MRKLALALIAIAVFVPAVQAAPTEVLVKDDFFKPNEVTIKKNTKVIWRWRGSDVHNVVIRKPGSTRIAKRSGVKTDGRFTYEFGRTGTWRILCEIHDRMRMKVIVRSP